MATKNTELRQKVSGSFNDNNSKIALRSHWNILEGIPSEFNPAAHYHDDRYAKTNFSSPLIFNDSGWTSGSHDTAFALRANGTDVFKITKYGQGTFQGIGASSTLSFNRHTDNQWYAQFNTSGGAGVFYLRNTSNTTTVSLNANGKSNFVNGLQWNGVDVSLSTHTHGNITNAGAIGSTADLVVVTGASGVLTTQSRSGIDSRSTFPPSAHTHALPSITSFDMTGPAILGRDASGSGAVIELGAGSVKSMLSLNNVENKSSSTIRSEITKANIEAVLTDVITSHTHALPSHNLTTHSDVVITAPSANHLLQHNGTSWINRTLAEAGIEPSFTKNTGFNKAFGTTAGTVAEGNHTHGSYNRASSVLSGANVFSNLVISNGIVTSVATRALSASDVSAMPIGGGTFTGAAVAQTNTAYNTRQVRNVIMSTADPSGGSNGDIWIKYTA